MTFEAPEEHTWRPTYRGMSKLVQVQRNGRVEMTALIDSGSWANGKTTVEGISVERMLDEMPLPFATPGIALATNTQGFLKWWRMIVYGAGAPSSCELCHY